LYFEVLRFRALNKNMKYLGIFFSFMLMGSCLKLGAQTYSTKETKVILVVSSKTRSVSHIVLFHVFQNQQKEDFFKQYSEYECYVGLLEGSYVIKDGYIVPKKETKIIMYTEKQVFPEAHFSPADTLLPGDRFDLGKTKAKVISSKKGELVLKT